MGNMAVKQQDMQKAIKKTKTMISNAINLNPSENPLSEANTDVQLAYDAFINAREELSEAVQEQEDQGKAASKNAEKRYQTYRLIVEQAFNEREATEREAMNAYRESIEKAGKIYRDIIQAALGKCKLITDNAWEASLEVLKASPTGEVNNVSRTWPKIKEILRKFAKQTRTHTVQWLNKTKIFIKSKLNSLKSTNTQTERIQ
jgi:hypothetical protein